ncbi:MAG: NADH-quinone oxidoreductase subunit J [Deltaproteobacteria bacterium]|nr:NADH-quinone oxidoreductase subunit J [Deltaproteobacteria bacterium]
MIGSVMLWIAAVLLVVTYIYAVLAGNPVYSAISMGIAFFLTAFVFVLLGAPFLAAVQVIVYVGAMLVMFLFIVMMFDLNKSSIAPVRYKPSTVLSYFLIMLVLLVSFFMARGVAKMPEGFTIVGFGSARNIGFNLMHYYLLPFELASFVLLVGVFGAIAFIKNRKGT